jgi:putative sterol carrier protein
MSDIVVPGFKSSELIAELSTAFDAFSSEERAKLIKQVNGVFQFVIKNSEGKEEVFTVDVKNEGKVFRGKGNVKADAILSLKDADFVDLATGKLNGKCFAYQKLL